MNYTLTTPCKNCPFLRTENYLTKGRVRELKQELLYNQGTFSCHKTNGYDNDGDAIETDKSQHCAGAMILLEKLGKPNQMMRISERLGMYDMRKLNMKANVFDTFEEMMKAQDNPKQLKEGGDERI